jgi:hypothetical protein
MATKKKAAKKKAATASGLSAALVFKKEWIFDPPPPFLRLDKAAITKINQLKTDFVKRVNEVIKGG